MSDSAPSGTRSVKSAERVLVLLELLARAATPVTVHELQRTVAFPRSSLHALLSTMVRTGWAVHQGGGYALGPVAQLLGSTQLEDVDIVEAAAPILTRLRDELQETVHLATLDGHEVLYLASRFSPHALGVRFQAGRRLPAQITALGKAMLAACPGDTLTAHMPKEFVMPTPKSVRSAEQLHTQLQEVRGRGYGIDDEETAMGLRCFAVALPIPMPPPLAISCSTPVARLDRHREAHIVSALRRASEEILRQIPSRL